jgi:hypothetical protein
VQQRVAHDVTKGDGEVGQHLRPDSVPRPRPSIGGNVAAINGAGLVVRRLADSVQVHLVLQGFHRVQSLLPVLLQLACLHGREEHRTVECRLG